MGENYNQCTAKADCNEKIDGQTDRSNVPKKRLSVLCLEKEHLLCCQNYLFSIFAQFRKGERLWHQKGQPSSNPVAFGITFTQPFCRGISVCLFFCRNVFLFSYRPCRFSATWLDAGSSIGGDWVQVRGWNHSAFCEIWWQVNIQPAGLHWRLVRNQEKSLRF